MHYYSSKTNNEQNYGLGLKEFPRGCFLGNGWKLILNMSMNTWKADVNAQNLHIDSWNIQNYRPRLVRSVIPVRKAQSMKGMQNNCDFPAGATWNILEFMSKRLENMLVSVIRGLTARQTYLRSNAAVIPRSPTQFPPFDPFSPFPLWPLRGAQILIYYFRVIWEPSTINETH